MKRKIIIGIISIACGMAAMSAMQSCCKDDKGGGDGDEDPIDPALTVTAGVNYSGGASVILFGQTSINSQNGYDRFFEMDTVPDPRVRYDGKAIDEKKFHCVDAPVLPVNGRPIYYRAVVAKGADTVRSKVETYQAEFPFISARVSPNGNTVTVRGQFSRKEFDRGRLEYVQIIICERVGDEGSWEKATEYRDDVSEDGSFTFSLTDLHREGEITSPVTQRPSTGDYYVQPKYKYGNTEYTYSSKDIPSHWHFHIDAQPTISIPDEAFRNYAVTSFGSDGRLTEEQALAVEGLDMRGLGVKSLEGLEAFRNIRYLLIDDNPIPKLEISEVFRGANLDTVTCSSCGNLTGIYSNIRIPYLDCHDCHQLSAMNYGGVGYLNCSGCNITCNLGCRNDDDTLGDDYESLDCSYNGITSLKGFYGCKLLNCSHNKLTELDLHDKYGRDIRTDTLDCSFNLLNILDISDSALKKLDCTNNPNLDTIYVDNWQMQHSDFIKKDEHTNLYVKGQ